MSGKLIVIEGADGAVCPLDQRAWGPLVAAKAPLDPGGLVGTAIRLKPYTVVRRVCGLAQGI